jgi:hypothetical protein
MPTYSSADMPKLLPQSILKVQGNRIGQLDAISIQKMLEETTLALDETSELRSLSEDAKIMNNQGIMTYLIDLADQKYKAVQD